MSELKGKLTFGQLDLSAFLVSTLVTGLQLDTPVSLNKKADPKKPQIMNVELTVSGKEVEPSTVYGEIVICDFLAGLKNQQSGAKCIRLG